MTNGLIDYIIILLLIMLFNAILLYGVIRLAVTHALRSRQHWLSKPRV